MNRKLLLAISFTISLNAQDLKTSIAELLETNPIILERLQNYNATKGEVKTTQSAYYPSIDLSLGAGIEQKSTLDTTPNVSKDLDAYQATLKYTQNIFNGFKTTHQVEQQEYRTISAAYSYIEKVNDTAFELADAYIQVMKNNELLQTAKENVETNNEIFIKVKKLYESGLTTLSEVNKIESTLALSKSNLVVQENTLLDTSYKLHRIMGRYLDVDKMVKPELDVLLPNSLEEATQYAITHNPSLLISNYNIKLAQATKKEKESSFYPKLDLEVSQSYNKNLNVIEAEDSRFKAMAYINYNIFNGFLNSNELQNSISKIYQEVEIKNTLRREVIEGLNLSWAANTKLQKQLKYLQKYKDFSFKTLTLYTKEYDLGRRSLLDLLSAQNDFIGAKSQIINTKYNILFSKYRILDAMGTLLTTVMGENNPSFAKVDLVPHADFKKDSLPIQLDRDNDLIPDDKDICDNSLSLEMKNIYGCGFKDINITQIERYNGFEFDDDSDDINFQTKKNIDQLLLQLKPYGYKNIRLELLSNAFNEDLSDKELVALSYKRAQKIESIFIDAGFIKKNILIVANGNTAPIYLENEDKNNRVDIIVKKLRSK
jgi:outer membrane protein, adhesin transport system